MKARLWRIRDRATFEALRQPDARVSKGPLALSFVGGDGPPRLGFAVGRKVGGAVQRNRLRRRLRAVFAEMAGELPPGAYLVSASRGAAELPYRELRELARWMAERVPRRP
ncbi:MAG TPA: ribonuclease P protein component [Acidimicrobiales bacterium]|nr:ribonuclease P protein component [Acidimicrobiales bacterium]